jgi:hypothetical protein
MADNVGYTPGSGASIAADDISGNLHQRVKITLGADGVSNGDLSSSNPLPIVTSGSTTVNVSTGELIESMEAMRMALQALTRTIGMSLPDAAGRQRVLIDSITSGLTLSTVTSIGGITNLQTAGTNSYNLNDAVPSLMHMQADNLRRNITVS